MKLTKKQQNKAVAAQKMLTQKTNTSKLVAKKSSSSHCTWG